MKAHLIGFSAFLFLLAAWPASSTPTELQALADSATEREIIERDIANRLAPLRTQIDLQLHVRKLPSDSPLRLLSEGARSRFLRSLVFTEKGLASFEMTDLRQELGAADIYRVLSLFGAQHSTKSIPGLRVTTSDDAIILDHFLQNARFFVDYPNRACAPPATCVFSVGDICIGDNCGMGINPIIRRSAP